MERKSLSDRKSTRLNSSHLVISYAVFCFKKTKWGWNVSNERTGLRFRESQHVVGGIDSFFFFNDTAPPDIYSLSLHDALPIWLRVVGKVAEACEWGFGGGVILWGGGRKVLKGWRLVGGRRGPRFRAKRFT